MEVHLYTLCWNEADMLGFFFRHYDPWVDRYVVFDDGSTDGSLELLLQHPKVEVRPFPRVHPDSFVLSQRDLQNEIWKESRGIADWVVITALDEHLEIKGRPHRDYLAASASQGVTLIPAVGFQMVSEDFPGPDERLASTRTHGAPWVEMNKLSLFNPLAVEETGFAVGRHTAQPRGKLVFPPRDELMLLHYKYIGFERTLQRHQAQGQGLGKTDVRNKWGDQYRWPRERLRAEWDVFTSRLVDVAADDFEPWRHAPPSESWLTQAVGLDGGDQPKLRRSRPGSAWARRLWERVRR